MKKEIWAAMALACAFAGFLAGRFSLLCQGPAMAPAGDAALVELPAIQAGPYLAREPGNPDNPAPLVDLNRAGEQQLRQLPGIGPKKAANIIAYRRQNGPFESIEELLAVEGIGEQIFMDIRDFVTIGPAGPELAPFCF